MSQVRVKVSGEEEAVKQFLKQIEKTFELIVESKLLNNRSDIGVHCFIDLNPYTLKEDKNSG